LKNLFSYKAFNFEIYSEFSFRTKPETSYVSEEFYSLYVKQYNEEIKLDKTIFERKNIQIFNNGFTISAGGMYFLYDHQNKIIYVKQNNHRLFEAYFWGPVIALVGAFFNFIPIHSSGMVVRDKSLLILGNSGSGKSSLLYEIMNSYDGYYFSDDLILLNKQNNLVFALPSYPDIKLWYDAVERLGASKVNPIYYKINKYYVDDKSRFLDQKTVPEILIFLHTSTQATIQIEEIKGSKKWLYLQSMLYRKHWIENAFQKKMFEVLSALSNQCTAYKIIRPLKINKIEWDETLKSFFNQIL